MSSGRHSAMAVLGEEDDGWDPSWEEEDAPARQGARGGAAGEAEVQQPKSWEDFWDGACQANEQAMHDAAKGGAVQHEQKQLVDGLPANGDLRCSGCARLGSVEDLASARSPVMKQFSAEVP